jgi:Flp pilus assembly protein TadD
MSSEKHSSRNDTGIRLVEQGEVSAGIKNFRAALELQPGNAELLRNLSWGLFRAGESREPRKEYETAIHLNPRDWQAHCGLGDVLARQNHLPEGIK